MLSLVQIFWSNQAHSGACFGFRRETSFLDFDCPIVYQPAVCSNSSVCVHFGLSNQWVCMQFVNILVIQTGEIRHVSFVSCRASVACIEHFFIY